jgi:anti-sigma B factor antagonist
MNITEQKFGETVMLSIQGRLDTINYGALESKLLEMIGTGQVRIVVNCEQMDYISSSGLRVFLLGLKKITPLNGKFVLTNLQNPVREIMEVAGFTSIFEIYGNQDEALNAAKN